MIPTVRRNVPAKIKAFNSQFAFLKQPWGEMTPKQIADTLDIFHGQSPEMLPEGRLFRVSPGGGGRKSTVFGTLVFDPTRSALGEGRRRKFEKLKSHGELRICVSSACIVFGGCEISVVFV